MQHPSSAPMPVIVTTKKKNRGPAKRHRLPQHRLPVALSAAALVCLALTLGLAEATGVTNLSATVIRIFTPNGTLVVEANDPGVKVTVEGDGGLTITGAGLEEIRLRPGSYKVHANKDGQPVALETEVVSIATGGREVVKVKLEGAQAVAAAKGEKGAFVLLGGAGVAERKFDTLANAVSRAGDGDTIEIRSNGPLISQPIIIRQTALTIRAGDGYAPVIRLSPEAVEGKLALITTDSPLVLEGLELAPPEPEQSTAPIYSVVQSVQLRAVNCRFRAYVMAYAAPGCEFRNCEFLSHKSAVGLGYLSGARVSFENCVFLASWAAIGSHYQDAPPRDVSIIIKSSTFVSDTPLWLGLECPFPTAVGQPPAAKFLRIDVSRSILSGTELLGVVQPKLSQLEPADAEAALLRLVEWRGERNVFACVSHSVRWSAEPQPLPPHGPKSLEEWKRFWTTTEADSLEGTVRLQGGNLLSRTENSFDELALDDFRLRPGSAGYRAGPDGKDLGADVDLVGPGPAYERWKKTPEYQQWLKDTKQTKTEATKPEPKAFVVLTTK